MSMLVVPLTAEGNDFEWYVVGGFTVFPEGTSVEIANTEGYGNRWGGWFSNKQFFRVRICSRFRAGNERRIDY